MPSYGSIFCVLCTIFVAFCGHAVNIGKYSMLCIENEPIVLFLFWVQCLHIPSCMQVFTCRTVGCFFCLKDGPLFVGSRTISGLEISTTYFGEAFARFISNKGKVSWKETVKRIHPCFSHRAHNFGGTRFFFYCKVTGRGIQLAARNKVVDPLSLSRVSSSPFFRQILIIWLNH